MRSGYLAAKRRPIDEPVEVHQSDVRSIPAASRDGRQVVHPALDGVRLRLGPVRPADPPVVPLQDTVVRGQIGLAELELLVHQRKAADQRKRRLAFAFDFVPQIGALHPYFGHAFLLPSRAQDAAASY